MINTLLELKNEGHKLLDEYIMLDLHRGSIKAERIHAYAKLSTKLNRNPHFSSMKTEEEVKEAIQKLKRMIKMRIKKFKYRGIDKIEVAPNVMELQRKASLLNLKQ